MSTPIEETLAVAEANGMWKERQRLLRLIRAKAREVEDHAPNFAFNLRMLAEEIEECASL